MQLVNLSYNFITPKFYMIIAFACVLNSCHEKKMKNTCYNQIDFIFCFKKSVPLIYKGGIIYQRFTFYRNEILCVDDTIKTKVTSLDVYFPDNYTSFSLNGNHQCKCVYTYEKYNNDFKSDTINTGTACGTLVDKNLWKIKIKIKEFNFEGIVSSNEKYNQFRIN